jgi:Restriction endonuclease
MTVAEQQPNSKTHWREFEKLAANIQKQLAPGARVSSNVRLLGKRTGIERQIDILVEQTVGQYSIRIVIDCKDYQDTVDVKDIETFMGMVEDVGANKGAIIAASGFSSTAKQRAKDAGIDLYRLVDTQSTKWGAYVSIPVVMRESFIHWFNFRFTATGYSRLPNCDPRLMVLHRADGTPIDCLHNLVLDRWESNAIPGQPGEYHDIPACDGETFVKTEGQLYKMKVFINAVVKETLYFGQLPISETKGFADEITGDFLTSELVTAPFNPYTIQKKWEQIASIEQLAVQPLIVGSVKSSAARIEDSAVALVKELK